jgi:hypothetical protein
MRKVVPLQVADIIAYESYKEFDRRAFHSEHKPRPGLRYLEDLINVYSNGNTLKIGDELSPIILYTSAELADFSQTIDGDKLGVKINDYEKRN